MASRTASKDIIALRGSAAIVSEFFGYAANSILYNRAVYPGESFAKVKKYGLTMPLTQDEWVNFITSATSKNSGKLQGIVMVIMSKATSEVIERWNFNIDTYPEVVEKGSIKEKSDKKIMREIRAIKRQIDSCITDLPCLDEPCVFDMLAYTDTDVDAPDTWIESDTKLIHNTQMVKLHSFDTKVHKVDTVVSYKKNEDDTSSSSSSVIREARIELLEAELGRFVMLANESAEEMYTRLKKIIKKIRSYGSKKWTDHEVVKIMLRAYFLRNSVLCFMIRDSPNYEKMTPEVVLGRFIRHEMMENEGLLEAELGRFVMLADESAEEMYTRLKKIINKLRSYGSKRWTDHEVVKIMLRAYFLRNSVLCFLIRQSPNYEKMTPEVVLSKFIDHETLLEEAKYVDIMSKSVTASKNQDIALKANKKQKGKCVFEESTSEDNEDSSSLDEEKIALIKSFKKIMKSRNYKSNKKNDKE
ncbi:uncharacterized protein [Zea mays]|uniref:uncharacterized protein isoform X1 n=1 Tax=Zea mays TaxID=4577 RepID=UPI0004DE8930|nr:uncharacterized protein LOC100277636 isoform X1 [Zea mays]|eukprot:XP_008667704.1 uncharacterized protein LOC100277636 isoform X2 [Zea mays]